MTISLTGFMGCGKSSVGRKLSALLCWSYADLDDVIEKKAGRSIPEIFASEGEAVFRQMELDSLKELVSCPADPKQGDMILSLGGGTVMTQECAEIIHRQTLCIYLRASVDTLVSHLEGEAGSRPMLNTDISLRKRITLLMEQRSATYEGTAHHIIDTERKTIAEIAQEIATFVKNT